MTQSCAVVAWQSLRDSIKEALFKLAVMPSGYVRLVGGGGVYPQQIKLILQLLQLITNQT